MERKISICLISLLLLSGCNNEEAKNTATTATESTIEEKNIQSKEKDLNEHFGNISLTKEEIDRLAEHIIGADTEEYKQLKNTLIAFDSVEQEYYDLEDLYNKINEFNKNFSSGKEFTAEEINLYINNLSDYFKRMSNFVYNNLILNLELFHDDKDVKKALITMTTEDLETISEVLKKISNEFKNGFNDLNIEKISEELLKIEEIRKKYPPIE